MKFLRLHNGIAAAAAITAVSVAITWRVHAQSTQTAPAAMPPMDHMMHEHMQGIAAPGGHPPMSEKSDDARELVSLPDPMQEHMPANMRDHLTTLNTVIGDIANANFDVASKLLEERGSG